jgi:hypothetical protein
MYKITPFLTWLHRYADLVGLEQVPSLNDLYNRRLALAGYGFWNAGVLVQPRLLPPFRRTKGSGRAWAGPPTPGVPASYCPCAAFVAYDSPRAVQRAELTAAMAS